MRGIARLKDRVYCPSCNKFGHIIQGCRHEFVDGRPIALLGHLSTRGPIITGSRYRFENNRPVARLFDLIKCDCGGIGFIITASHTEFLE